MELIHLLDGLLAGGRGGERFGYTLAADFAMQTELRMAFSIRLGTMAAWLPSAPRNRSHTARAEIAQAEELTKQACAERFQIINRQGH
jgi:hypothetical protein